MDRTDSSSEIPQQFRNGLFYDSARNKLIFHQKNVEYLAIAPGRSYHINRKKFGGTRAMNLTLTHSPLTPAEETPLIDWLVRQERRRVRIAALPLLFLAFAGILPSVAGGGIPFPFCLFVMFAGDCLLLGLLLSGFRIF